MMNFLLVCDGPENLANFEKALAAHEKTGIERVHTGDAAILRVKDRERTPDLVVVDETVGKEPGRDWIERIVSANAMINTALVSGLSDEDFHEYTEGLGVLMPLPPNPDAVSAGRVIDKLAKVLSLYQALSQ